MAPDWDLMKGNPKYYTHTYNGFKKQSIYKESHKPHEPLCLPSFLSCWEKGSRPYPRFITSPHIPSSLRDFSNPSVPIASMYPSVPEQLHQRKVF